MSVSAPTAGIPIILCADDYGIAPGVSRAIRDLIARRVLTATGCMTGGPWWPEEGVALRPLSGMADCGLHITLTDQAPLGAMPRTAPGIPLPEPPPSPPPAGSRPPTPSPFTPRPSPKAPERLV